MDFGSLLDAIPQLEEPFRVWASGPSGVYGFRVFRALGFWRFKGFWDLGFRVSWGVDWVL